MLCCWLATLQAMGQSTGTLQSTVNEVAVSVFADGETDSQNLSGTSAKFASVDKTGSSSSSAGGQSSAVARAEARARQGGVSFKAVGTAITEGENVQGVGLAAGTAVTTSSVLLDSPDFDPDEIVTAVASFNVSGSYSFNAENGGVLNMQGGWSVSVNDHAGLGGSGLAGGFQIANNSLVVDDLTTGSLLFQYNVKNGVPHTIQIQSTFLTNCVAPETSDDSRSSCSSSVNYGNSFTWGGITEIRDSSGNVSTNFTAIDGDGADWTLPVTFVPEPSSLVLLALGGLPLALRRRNRGR